MKWQGVVLVAIGMMALPGVAGAEMREFTSGAGQTIKAELISYKGSEITLRREDGREFKVTASSFSLDDQIYIKKWMDNTPETVNYHFRIDAQKKKLDGTVTDLDYKRVKNEKWAYQVTITNLSRDPVANLTVKYKVFYSNQADGEFSAFMDDTTNQGVIRGEAKLKQEMAFNQTMEFTTKEVAIDLVDYDYGSRYKDSLKGAMIRVEDAQGKVVADWVMPISYLRNQTWESTEPRGASNSGVIIR